MEVRIEAFERLRCPSCGGKLELDPFSKRVTEDRTFVEDGIFVCWTCAVYYPVQGGTPVMLRFKTPFHDGFHRRHADQLRGHDRLSPPRGEPRPGEAAVQASFTEEWDLTREDELSFGYTAGQLVELNRRVWLRWLAELPEDERPRLVLDVGCGAGMEAEALLEATAAEHVFAVDLNFALLARRPRLRDRSDISFVIASLFDLPFEPEGFDLVYSQGVLHHTYSTAEAFDAIAPQARAGGRLFVWVYGLADQRPKLVERILRPLVSRAPGWLRNALFKLLTPIQHRRTEARWPWRADRWERVNTEHALRDWLSPRYAHRHGYNEVMGWFERNGFRVTDTQSPTAFRELFDSELLGVGLTGRRLLPRGSESEADPRVRASVSGPAPGRGD